MAGKREYEFRRVSAFNNKILICPDCAEGLDQSDIESYHKCPYCDFSFQKNGDIEDFILEPVVEQWMSQYKFPFDPEGVVPRQRHRFF